jgi:uroporphyrinogen-III synthase
VGKELLHADGRTDMTKPIVAFCNTQTRLNTETLENWDYDIIAATSEKGINFAWPRLGLSDGPF